jgi:hypothetical protein
MTSKTPSIGDHMLKVHMLIKRALCSDDQNYSIFKELYLTNSIGDLMAVESRIKESYGGNTMEYLLAILNFFRIQYKVCAESYLLHSELIKKVNTFSDKYLCDDHKGLRKALCELHKLENITQSIIDEIYYAYDLIGENAHESFAERFDEIVDEVKILVAKRSGTDIQITDTYSAVMRAKGALII